MAKWQTGSTDGTEMARGFNVLNRWAAPQIAKPIVNGYRDAALAALASTTSVGTTNVLAMMPFLAGETFTIDRLGVSCTAVAASAQVKCLIYDSDADGWPNAPVCAPTDNLDLASSTGFKEHTLSPTFQFEAGKLYWVGCRFNQGATIRSIALGACRSFGPDSVNGGNQMTQIVRLVTYANAPPNPWVFNASELVTGTPPSVRWRVASVP